MFTDNLYSLKPPHHCAKTRVCIGMSQHAIVHQQDVNFLLGFATIKRI
jgi:hypothetical protein